MKILKDFLNLIIISFGVIISVIFIHSVINNGFNFSNLFAKILVFLFGLIILFVIRKISLSDKYYQSDNVISGFIFVMFFIVIFGGLCVSKNINLVNKDYIAFSTRKTNKQDYTIETERDENGIVKEYKEYFYTDPIIKNSVIQKHSSNYNRVRNLLLKNNEYVSEIEYRYWQTAVVDGFQFNNKASSLNKGFYYIIEICGKTIPFLIFIIILNFIFLIFTRFKYSLLKYIYQPLNEEKYDCDKSVIIPIIEIGEDAEYKRLNDEVMAGIKELEKKERKNSKDE